MVILAVITISECLTGFNYPNQYQGLQEMLRREFITRPFIGSSGRTVISAPYYATDGQSPSYQTAQTQSRDIVAVNIENINGRLYQVLYANGWMAGPMYRMD